MDNKNGTKVEKLVRILEMLEITQVEFSDLLDMNKSYINRILGGKTNITNKFLEKVCETFGAPLEYFDDNVAIDIPLNIKKYEQTPVEGYYSDPNLRLLHKQLDNLIEYRGKNDHHFIQGLSSMLNNLLNYLNCKDNYKDPDEGLEKSEDWLTSIENDIMEM